MRPCASSSRTRRASARPGIDVGHEERPPPQHDDLVGEQHVRWRAPARAASTGAPARARDACGRRRSAPPRSRQTACSIASTDGRRPVRASTAANASATRRRRRPRDRRAGRAAAPSPARRSPPPSPSASDAPLALTSIVAAPVRSDVLPSPRIASSRAGSPSARESATIARAQRTRALPARSGRRPRCAARRRAARRATRAPRSPSPGRAGSRCSSPRPARPARRARRPLR